MQFNVIKYSLMQVNVARCNLMFFGWPFFSPHGIALYSTASPCITAHFGCAGLGHLRAARRARRTGSTGYGDGYTVPFCGLFRCIFDGRSCRKRPSTGRRVLKTRHKRLNMLCMPFVKHVLCKGKPNTQFRTHLMNLLVTLNRRNDGRRMTDRSCSGPVETTAVPVTGTACSPRPSVGTAL
jgi:hypothetical protein